MNRNHVLRRSGGSIDSLNRAVDLRGLNEFREFLNGEATPSPPAVDGRIPVPAPMLCGPAFESERYARRISRSRIGMIEQFAQIEDMLLSSAAI
jgi:hypothetical protein